MKLFIKSTSLFRFIILLTILSSILTKSTSLYVKLLATIMWGIVIFSAIWVVYKTIKFKIYNK